LSLLVKCLAEVSTTHPAGAEAGGTAEAQSLTGVAVPELRAAVRLDKQTPAEAEAVAATPVREGPAGLVLSFLQYPLTGH
jgi:hypothetical protein